MLTRRRLLAAFSAVPAHRILRAQSSQDTPHFSADVKVVNVLATVRDRRGEIVRNLTKDDFVLDEDGRPQTIRYFSQESDLPLTLGILIDTSGSTRRVLPDEQSASYRFLEQVLREDKDQAFLVHFDFDVELLQDLTNSRRKLERALNDVETAGLRRYVGGYPGSRGGYGRRRGGGTNLYDAVYLSSNDLMRKQTGRKAIILLSDGADNGSRETLEGAVEAAQRADTLIYSILFQDPEFANIPPYGRMGRYPNEEPDGRGIMQQISQQTGGRFVEVTRRMPINRVFSEIEEDLRNQYSIGYTPDDTATAGYRHIHLATRQKNYVVQTREGYYPKA